MRVVREAGEGTLEIWDVEPSEPVLRALLTDLFTNHWQKITFGPLIQGAAWEITASNPPKRVGLSDGYLTVDFGPLHLHLCIGEHHGDPADPTPPDLAEHRRTKRAELYRRINRDGAPDVWGLRLFNGKDEQQVTILFPNPFLTDDLRPRDAPDWSRLMLWEDVRQRYLGLGPDPRDRTGHRMVH